jgi:hypothetical protein
LTISKLSESDEEIERDEGGRFHEIASSKGVTKFVDEDAESASYDKEKDRE